MIRVDPEKGLGRRVGTVAFWARGNEIYENDGSHIAEIIRTSERFGLTLAHIRAVYDHHGELLGVEGAARAQLIREAAGNGWIRVRHYVGTPDYWSIQADRYTATRRAEILAMVKQLLSLKVMVNGDQLKIECSEDRAQVRYLFQDGGVAKFLADSIP